MSFVPAPQQANAAGASNAPAAVNPSAAGQAPAEIDIHTLRNFDVFWVEKNALMYKDGIDKAFNKETRKSVITKKMKSSIPIILRDMAPPRGSIFDPAIKWGEEKERRRQAQADQVAESEVAASKGKKGKSGKKSGEKKKSAADTIKESNAAEKLKKDHVRDIEKLSNLRTLKSLQEISCDTTSGKIHRMIKMLHLAVSDLKQGTVHASEAEVLDILWALEEMPDFKQSEDELSKEKAAKKEDKKIDKSDKKSSKKDSKKDKKSVKKETKEEIRKVVLSTTAQSLKNLLKDGGDSRGSYKDSLKYARKLMTNKDDLIAFQMTEMADRLPPLSRYNRKFQLEKWQCNVLEAIDNGESAVVCAPTSSGKTLLSTYTCKVAKGTVLFVLPSEVLVWQIASTYYQFFKGNVTVCTDLITFQETSGEAQVYIGTPRALEKSLSKVRGCAGEEIMKGEREFMVLDGGYHQFDYLVLDEVHTLNGPEGDALQRIIKCCSCPVLALSATIGNAQELNDWFGNVLKQHVEASIIDATEDQYKVTLQEHSARFINLQRYVVTDTKTKDGKKKKKLSKLHPVAAMTKDRLSGQTELVSALSMTPPDMMDLWKRLRAIFPSTALEELDNPSIFFAQFADENHRISLDHTKEYELRLKSRLTALSKSHSVLYEKLRQAQLPPPLEASKDVSEDLYEVLEQMKQSDLLPAVGFQLNTFGAFNMFKTLLARLEREQLAEFPNYRADLIKAAREKAAMRKIAAGKANRENAAEAEEDAKSGFVDDSMIQEDTTRPHEKYVLSPAGKRLNFTEVEDIIADMKKSGETVDIDHALIRGLRRGIAIYTNEVGFACYRRQVQILAQQGRIAVVFSDAALAYGVNMPFRSCIFCGDMGDDLTPLIAQQMQGRAGRRGMDVQGNVIYLGMEWPYIENLMLGQISRVTGEEPRYPIMTLQHALAASVNPDDMKHFAFADIQDSDSIKKKAFVAALHKMKKIQNCFPSVTDEQMEWMCNTTLEEFCEGKTSDYYESLSDKVIHGLGYVHEDRSLAMDHNALTMVWDMHATLPVAVHLCASLDLMYYRFCHQKSLAVRKSDSMQNEFLSVLIHIVDRHLPQDGEESLQQLLRVEVSEDGKTNDDARDLWLATEGVLTRTKRVIDSIEIDEGEKEKLQLQMPPAENDGEFGPPLDKGVYEMLISKQKGFREDQTVARRNELKSRIVYLGEVCLIAHNNLQQPHGKYEELEIHFRRMFRNVVYSVNDMMSQLTDQADLTLI